MPRPTTAAAKTDARPTDHCHSVVLNEDALIVPASTGLPMAWLAEQCIANADFMKVASEAAKETGEAVSAFIDAASSADPAVRRRAREEGEEAIAALTKGLAALDAQERGPHSGQERGS